MGVLALWMEVGKVGVLAMWVTCAWKWESLQTGTEKNGKMR